MKRPQDVALLVGAMLLTATAPRAHHEWPVDLTNQITLSGTVAGIHWANPHVMIYLDVETGGTIERWTVGGSSPQFMTTCGWNKHSLKAGDKVTVIGYRFKDGSNAARMQTTLMPNGKEMHYGAPPQHEAQCVPRHP